MSDITPTPDSIAEQLLTFERELKAARSPQEARVVRDRFLGRKNSVVAS